MIYALAFMLGVLAGGLITFSLWALAHSQGRKGVMAEYDGADAAPTTSPGPGVVVLAKPQADLSGGGCSDSPPDLRVIDGGK